MPVVNGRSYLIRVGGYAGASGSVRMEVGDPCPPCVGDFNQDGGVDGSDIDTFFVAWENGGSIADVNQDGGIDGSDVNDFFIRWESGC